MKVSVKLFRSDGAVLGAEFPIKIVVTHKGFTQRETIAHVLTKDWDAVNQLPLPSCLGFDDLYPEILTIKARAAQRFVRTADDVKEVLNYVQDKEYNQAIDVDFYAFTTILVNEFKARKTDGGISKQGNAVVYINAVNQLKKYQPQLQLSDIDYTFLVGFKNWQLTIPNKKNTIHSYLRTYRAIYNEAIKRYKLEDTKPFNGVFKGITVKQNRTKKRHLHKCCVQILEAVKSNLPPGQLRAVDFWLLQFYLGGADLIDLYYLPTNKIANGRVYFMRGKLDDGGYEFDLKINSKAMIIINRYKTPGDYVFNYRKDYIGYKTFRANMRRSLKLVQQKYAIKVHPLDGNFTSKVARHTFSNIAKQLFIDADIIRELMGHERDDVDTIYKDKYSQTVRDTAQLKIIE